MCARLLGEHQDYCGGSLRAFFKQFVQLEVCSGKVALSRSRPFSGYPGILRQGRPPAVGHWLQDRMNDT